MEKILDNIIPIGILLLLIFSAYAVEFLLRQKAAKVGKRYFGGARLVGYAASLLALVMIAFLVYINAGTEWILAALMLALFGALL